MARFVIEFVYKMVCTVTYRRGNFTHDPRAIAQGINTLRNRREPLI